MSNHEFHKRSTLPGIPKPKDSQTPIVPDKIGPFKIESFLEKGGMSYLYLGTHPETKEPVTIKTLLPQYLNSPDLKGRFLNEAKIISLANHPNIVKLYSQDTWEGGLYIAMEFVQGISLRQYLNYQSLTLKRSLEIILEIGYALCHLHTHGIIHRDLKLENVLINDEGKIKLIDFGVAHNIKETDTIPLPTPQVIGTPIYMSPEQRKNPETVTFASDIYSLGIIAYELVTGKLSQGKIHISLLPKGLQSLISKCLQNIPEDRYHDVVDFISDISKYLNSLKDDRQGGHQERLGELTESLRQIEQKMKPQPFQMWKNVKISFFDHHSHHPTSIHYDFLELPNNYLLFISIDCTETGSEGLILLAHLRGIFLATKEKLKSSPAEWLLLINSILLENPIQMLFSISLLLIDPNWNEYHFFSCGDGTLWHLHEDGKIDKIASKTTVIGLDKDLVVNKESYPLKKNERLAFISSSLIEDLDPLIIQKIVERSLEFDGKPFVEAIFRKIQVRSKDGLQSTPLLIFLFEFKTQDS